MTHVRSLCRPSVWTKVLWVGVCDVGAAETRGSVSGSVWQKVYKQEPRDK